MKEDWLNKVHDRMTDYEIEEPEGLWNRIELKQRNIPGAVHSNNISERMIWVKRCIVAAAMIIVLVSAGIYYLTAFREHDSEAELLEDIRDKYITDCDSRPATVNNGVANGLADKLTAMNSMGTRPCSESKDIECPKVSATEVISVERVDAEDEPDISESEPERAEPVVRKRPLLYSDKNHKLSLVSKKPDKNRVFMSIYTSGGTGSGLSYSSECNSAIVGVGPDNSVWEDKPMLGILVFNQGKDIETDIKHRLPIRAGISFTYLLNDRLGIESGLSYAYLSSVIKKGSDSHYYTEEQHLHYLGIPINLKYRVGGWRIFELYTSGGVLAEKCVSATLDKEFILNYHKNGIESDNLSEKPLQWSVNASLGVQCNLVTSMSLFVEPGISYYFNDGTNIPTIYKEKPLNFNLNIGMRFTLGK